MFASCFALAIDAVDLLASFFDGVSFAEPSKDADPAFDKDCLMVDDECDGDNGFAPD
jgi:hypothetical protein